MRCQVKAGFLMLRQCNRVAADKCCFCGIAVCTEHAYPLTREQIEMYNVPKESIQPVSCQQCIQQKMQGTTGQPDQQAPPAPGQQPYQQQRDYYDPYPYPYYGGYHPYYWGDDFSDRDRRAFDHRSGGSSNADAGDTNTLES